MRGKDDGLAQRCRAMVKRGAQSQTARVQIPALPPFMCKLLNVSLCQFSYLRMIILIVLTSWSSSEELVSCYCTAWRLVNALSIVGERTVGSTKALDWPTAWPRGVLLRPPVVVRLHNESEHLRKFFTLGTSLALLYTNPGLPTAFHPSSPGVWLPPFREWGSSDQPCKDLEPENSELPITESLEQKPNGHLEIYRQDNLWKGG